MSPSLPPKTLRFCGVVGCASPFLWVPAAGKQFFSLPLGGARLSGIAVYRVAQRASNDAAPSTSPVQGS